jgi:hypothetical protein
MSQSEPGFRALQREWIAARLVLALGIVGAGATFTWLWFHRPVAIEPAGSTDAASSATSGSSEGGASSANAGSQGQLFCSTTVTVAQSFGIVPPAAKPDGTPQKTDVQGRYVCVAQGDTTKYTISVDLMCRDLGEQHCFNLFNVTQSDGNVLYQRQS